MNFNQFIQKHSEENISVNTYYGFDKKRNYAKLIRLPAEFPVDRTPIEDLKEVIDYPSEMTELDFVYVKQILTFLKMNIKDYLNNNALKN